MTGSLEAGEVQPSGHIWIGEGHTGYAKYGKLGADRRGGIEDVRNGTRPDQDHMVHA